MRLNRCTALALVLSAGAVPIGRASADTWNVARHDPARTGASTGSVPLDGPSVRWRAYVGGRPTDASARFGMSDPAVVVSSSGGRFIARNVVTQAEQWSSELIGAGTVVDLADLDGDGAREVIVQTAEQAHVLDATTGSLLWSSPMSAMQIMGSVRVIDVNGDGLPDVYLDNGVGAKPGTELAAAYSFAGGITKLWSLPMTITPVPVNSGTDSLLDVDDDGIPEVLLTSWSSIRVVRGNDGSTLTTLESPAIDGNAFYQASALAAQLDSTSTKEVVVVQSVAYSSLQITPGLSVFSLDPTAGQSDLLWKVDAGSFDAEIAANADTATDLDGDGKAEVIFSYRSSTTGDEWVTELLDGASGAVLDVVVGARFEGAAELDQEPGSELILATTTGLSIFAFDGAALSPLGGPLDGVRALSLPDPALRGAGQLRSRVATLTLPTGPTLFVGGATGLASPQAAATTFSDVRGVTFNGTDFETLGTFTPLVGVVTGVTRADGATRPYAQLAVGTSEGLLSVLDSQLASTNGSVWLGLDPVGTFVGGGSISPALVGNDDDGSFIVLPGTAVGTVVADVGLASLIIPPLPRWWRTNLSNPSVISLDGVSHVVGIENDALVARTSASGSKSGQVTMPQGWIWGSPIPMHVNGDGGALVGVDWRIDGTQVAQTGVDFSTETILWSGAPIAIGGFFGSSALDIDGDGTDEWFSLSSTLNRRDMSTGSVSSLGDFPQLGYSMPLLAPFKSAAPELLLQSGGQGPTLLESDFSVAWQGSVPEPINGMAGTRTTCGGSSRFVTPAVQSASIRAYDGASGALVAEKLLAGGQAFANASDAAAAGVRPGLLSHASSVADVAGQGAAVLVGSTDGNVYVLDACTLEVRWAADLGASVGEPVIADFDNDGEDEITVSASDGFVYGLDTNCFEAPVVSCGDGGDEILYVAPGEAVTFDWSELDGATSYEVALVSPQNKPLWSPAYRGVEGNSTVIELDGALAGRPYRLVVRGVGPEGGGAEGFSRPVVIRDLTPPEVNAVGEGGPSASLAITATDNLGLDNFVVRVTPDGESSRVVADGMLTGPGDGALAAFQPSKDLWGKDLEISIEVLDSARLSASTSIDAFVTDEGIVVMDAAVDEEPLPIDESENGHGHGPSYEAGGGCTSGPSSQSQGWPTVAALVALALSRRRRRAG